MMTSPNIQIGSDVWFYHSKDAFGKAIVIDKRTCSNGITLYGIRYRDNRYDDRYIIPHYQIFLTKQEMDDYTNSIRSDPAWNLHQNLTQLLQQDTITPNALKFLLQHDSVITFGNTEIYGLKAETRDNGTYRINIDIYLYDYDIEQFLARNEQARQKLTHTTVRHSSNTRFGISLYNTLKSGEQQHWFLYLQFNGIKEQIQLRACDIDYFKMMFDLRLKNDNVAFDQILAFVSNPANAGTYDYLSRIIDHIPA